MKEYFGIIIEKDHERRDGKITGKHIFRAFFIEHHPEIKGSPMGRGPYADMAIWDLCRRTNFESGTEFSKNDLTEEIFRDFTKGD